MNKIRYVVALVVGLVLSAPVGAQAQSGDWWGWALETVARSDQGLDVFGDREDRRQDREDREDREEWWDRDDDRDDDRYDDRDGWRDRDEDRYDDRRRRGEGPKFCRNGQGHPVHGRAWCRDKGFDGYGRLGTRTRWEDRGWEDVILGSPRERRERVSRGGLIDVLGEVVFGRLDRERRRAGGRAPLEGRWLSPRDGVRVLQIRSGGVPVAELSDLDGDGRVDVSLIPRR